MRIPDIPVWTLAVAQTLLWASLFYSFPALVLEWEADFGWSRSVLMGAFSAGIFAWAICAPVTGRIIDRGFGAQLITTSAVCGGVLLVLLPTADSIFGFYAIWIAIGATMSGALYEAAFAMVTRARGAASRAPITTITLVAGFAGTVSFPLAHWLAALGGWQLAVRVLGLICILGAAPLAFWSVGRLGGPADQPGTAAQTGSRLRNPAFWFLTVAFTCASIHGSVIVSHILPLLQDRGIPAALSVTLASFMGPMQVLSRVLLMLIGGRLSDQILTRLTFVAFAASVVILFLSGFGILFVGGFILLHGMANGAVTILRAVSIRTILGSQNYGRTAGSVAFFSLCGFAGAPLLSALVWRVGGYDLVLLLLLVLNGVALVSLTLATRSIKN